MRIRHVKHAATLLAIIVLSACSSRSNAGSSAPGILPNANHSVVLQSVPQPVSISDADIDSNIDPSIPADERTVIKSVMLKLPLTLRQTVVHVDVTGKIYSNRSAAKAAFRAYALQPNGVYKSSDGRTLLGPPTSTSSVFPPAATPARSVSGTRSTQAVYTPPSSGQSGSGPFHELYSNTYGGAQGYNFYYGEIGINNCPLSPQYSPGAAVDTGFIYTGGWSGVLPSHYPLDMGMQYSSTTNDMATYTLFGGVAVTSDAQSQNYRFPCGQTLVMQFGVYSVDAVFVSVSGRRYDGNNGPVTISRALPPGSGWDFSCVDCTLKQVISIAQGSTDPNTAYNPDGFWFGAFGASAQIRFNNVSPGICGLNYAQNVDCETYRAVVSANTPRGVSNAPNNSSVILTYSLGGNGWDEAAGILLPGGPFRTAQGTSCDPNSGPCGPTCTVDGYGYCVASISDNSYYNNCQTSDGGQVGETLGSVTYYISNASGTITTYTLYYSDSQDGRCNQLQSWNPGEPAPTLGDPNLP